MNRKIKNGIMIAIILIVCILSYFTMSVAVKNSMSSNGMFKNDFGGTLSNFNNGEFSEEDMLQRPSKEFGNGEMPNIGEVPEGFKNGEMPNIAEMPENFEQTFKNSNFSKGQFRLNISLIYYILFVVEGLIISTLLIYLIMSKFNSKTLKETFETGKKVIIFIILVLILTTGLTVVQSILAKNVFGANNMTQFEDIQRNINNINNLNSIKDLTGEENI